jgi:tetratricopeptide (TPR) repeat protein
VPDLEDLVRRFPSTPAYAIELATALNQLGNVFDWQKRPADAAEWYGRAVDELRVLATRYPHLSDLQSRAGQGEMNLGVQWLALRDPGRAAEHFERAVALQRRAIELAPAHAGYPGLLRWHHMAHSDSLIALGRYADAADAADAVADSVPDDWESCTRAGSQIAKILRAMAAAPEPDPGGTLADELVARAVAHLRRALDLGFPHVDELRTVPVLAPLRGHAAFEALIADVGAP